MPNGTASINYLSRLIGKNIILGDRNNLDGYGVFRFDSLTQEDGSVYSMSLTYVSGSGVIKALHYYGIQIDVDAIEGDKNFVFSQAAASATWVVQHNLNKFPIMHYGFIHRTTRIWRCNFYRPKQLNNNICLS